jgi:hypothetical protein
MKMIRYFALGLVVLILLLSFCLAGCGSDSISKKGSGEEKIITRLCYDKNGAEVTDGIQNAMQAGMGAKDNHIPIYITTDNDNRQYARMSFEGYTNVYREELIYPPRTSGDKETNHSFTVTSVIEPFEVSGIIDPKGEIVPIELKVHYTYATDKTGVLIDEDVQLRGTGHIRWQEWANTLELHLYWNYVLDAPNYHGNIAKGAVEKYTYYVFDLPDTVSGQRDIITTDSSKQKRYADKDDQSGLSISFGGNKKDDGDHTGPLSTISISILAILLSILFGNTGGFIPTVPVGTGGAPAPAPAGSGLSRWLRFDGDGDIEATDPVNGQRRTFVRNGDGTYTDPVSGATYTPEELSEQLEHRADNAGTIRQDEAQFEQNVSEDSQRNQERSDESSQLEKDLQRERQERSRKEKVERIATDLGMSGASEDDVRAELERRMERDEDYRQKMNDYAQRRDTAVDVLEATVEMADYTMAAGEALIPGGKGVSATYKGIKNTVSTMAEKGVSWGSFTEGAIKGGTEAATTMMKGGISKAGVSFGGTVAGEVAQAVNDGGDLTEALAEGVVKGTLNAASGAVGDAYGDMVGGDGALNKVAETAGKLGEVGFEKNVTGTVGDNLNGENK